VFNEAIHSCLKQQMKRKSKACKMMATKTAESDERGKKNSGKKKRKLSKKLNSSSLHDYEMHVQLMTDNNTILCSHVYWNVLKIEGSIFMILLVVVFISLKYNILLIFDHLKLL
jgi:uncharacterized Fe-S cluster-containing MiaB family protein